MSEKSPLDFFTSSSKNKSNKNKNKKTPAKTTSPATKKRSLNIEDALKPSYGNQTNEALAILENIQTMSQDLERQIQEAARASGKTPEEIEAIVEVSSEISAKDKADLKQLRSELAQKIKNAAQGKSSATSSKTTSTSKKKGKPTGDLRTKSIGTKRKWMPMK